MKDCRDCDNEERCGGAAQNEGSCPKWEPIPCPYCGGRLSEVRWNGRTPMRHCYSCHFEFAALVPRAETPEDCFGGMA